MAHSYYYVNFFNPAKHDSEGMPDPFNSYIFFLEVKSQQSFTEVEIYSADDQTRVSKALQANVIKKTNLKEVAEDVFEMLVNLPENKGLKYRRFF